MKTKIKEIEDFFKNFVMDYIHSCNFEQSHQNFITNDLWAKENCFKISNNLKSALEVIKELQARVSAVEYLDNSLQNAKKDANAYRELYAEQLQENITLKTRLEVYPESPGVDKITCLEIDVQLRDDKIKKLKTQIDRVKYKGGMTEIIFGCDCTKGDIANEVVEELQNYILGRKNEIY